jgi:hypothetical protein
MTELTLYPRMSAGLGRRRQGRIRSPLAHDSYTKFDTTSLMFGYPGFFRVA